MRISLLVPLFLFSSPLLAQTSTKATAPGATNILDCVRGLQDQNGGGCIEASSAATFGLLFPYPGLNNTFDSATGDVVSGGTGNTANGDFPGHSTVGGGDQNSASGPWSTISGGFFNTASSNANTVGGGDQNTASGGFYGHATVGGGDQNSASGAWSTISGGNRNTASSYAATVGGGDQNTASALHATVGGGRDNIASGIRATVVGGAFNTAYGYGATVGGGRDNTASGDDSMAAGRRAKAIHNGSFVWGDSVDVDKSSSAVNQFNVYASGGTRIFSNSAASAGVLLAPGGGSWTSVSDRNAKENIEVVDAREILERVASIPISTWNYKAQDDSIRHMGPMAQDFYAVFGLGLGETGIDTIDPDGVALAAIQGLRAEKGEEMAVLAERLAEKDAQIAALQARLEKLESIQVMASEE